MKIKRKSDGKIGMLNDFSVLYDGNDILEYTKEMTEYGSFQLKTSYNVSNEYEILSNQNIIDKIKDKIDEIGGIKWTK